MVTSWKPGPNTATGRSTDSSAPGVSSVAAFYKKAPN